MNRADLETIFIAAFGVARADRRVVDKEKELLDMFARVLNVDETRIAALLDHEIGLEEAAKHMSTPQAQEFLIKSMCAVAFADGQQKFEEVSLIGNVNGALPDPLELLPWNQWEQYVEEVTTTLLTFKLED